jgi:GDP-4-dehydro-6-deoxy-D-mannose reductase
MRVLVTGATGFAGRWLIDELEASGHAAIQAPSSDRLDLALEGSARRIVEETRPDAIAHLAAVSFGPDARRDPARAMAVNVGATRWLIEAAGHLHPPPLVLVAGSSEVYGNPSPELLPLREDAPLRPTQPYGESKLEQERVALAAGSTSHVPVVVTRAFNHTGPGQRTDFVAPALARRVLEARDAGSNTIRVGNVDVRRDIGDVRDTVRAYRLILEGIASGRVSPGSVLNVATGHSVSIREILTTLGTIAGASVDPVQDPSLVREDDPREIVGTAARLTELTGWKPAIPIERTLADLMASLETESPTGARPERH